MRVEMYEKVKIFGLFSYNIYLLFLANAQRIFFSLKVVFINLEYSRQEQY